MVVCSVVGCNSNSDSIEILPNGEKVILYPFPVQVIGRTKIFNTRRKYVCSKHVRPEQRDRDSKHELLNPYPKFGFKLKPDTVPTENVPFPLEIVQPPIVHTPIEFVEEQMPPNASKDAPIIFNLSDVPTIFNLSDVPGTSSSMLQSTLPQVDVPSEEFVGCNLLVSTKSNHGDATRNINHRNVSNPLPTAQYQSEANPNGNELKTEPFEYEIFCEMDDTQLTVPEAKQSKPEADEEQSVESMGAGAPVDDDSEDVENILLKYRVKTKSNPQEDRDKMTMVNKSFHCEPIALGFDLKTEIKSEHVASNSDSVDIEMPSIQEPGVDKTNIESPQYRKNLLKEIGIERKTIQELSRNNRKLIKEKKIHKEENKVLRKLVENNQRLRYENILFKEGHETVQFLVENNQLLVNENNILKLENDMYKQFLLQVQTVNLEPSDHISGPFILK